MAANVKIPYYTVRRNGRGFWEPTKHMRALGFRSVPCGPDGPDGPDAWAIAEEWNRRLLAVRKGEAPSPAMVSAENLSPLSAHRGMGGQGTAYTGILVAVLASHKAGVWR